MGFFRILLLFRILQIDLRIRRKLKGGILTACAPVYLPKIARKSDNAHGKHRLFAFCRQNTPISPDAERDFAPSRKILTQKFPEIAPYPSKSGCFTFFRRFAERAQKDNQKAQNRAN